MYAKDGAVFIDDNRVEIPENSFVIFAQG